MEREDPLSKSRTPRECTTVRVYRCDFVVWRDGGLLRSPENSGGVGKKKKLLFSQTRRKKKCKKMCIACFRLYVYLSLSINIPAVRDGDQEKERKASINNLALPSPSAASDIFDSISSLRGRICFCRRLYCIFYCFLPFFFFFFFLSPSSEPLYCILFRNRSLQKP